MRDSRRTEDYEPVTPASRSSARLRATEDAVLEDMDDAWHVRSTRLEVEREEEYISEEFETSAVARRKTVARVENWSGKQGHAFSFAGLCLFTAILYFRPYELISALAAFSSSAFYVALLTLTIFFPTQLGLEGNLTARPREVNLVLLFSLVAFLSIPLAMDRYGAWETFSGTFIKAVLMFIVMVNAVRTERRLKIIILLAVAVNLMLSVSAINDFRTGNLTVEGYRVAGRIGGMFDNPNDMALHLVIVLPIAIALGLSSRGLLRKLFYLASAVLSVAAVVVSFSRGGFLGMICVFVVLAWKIGRKQRFAVALAMFFGGLAFIALAPGNYGMRLASILIPGLDPNGSAGARQALLIRSIIVSLRHPLLGVGMGNFHILSIREEVSHNAFTQVSSEMGMIALALYGMFIVHPLKRLREIERETFAAGRDKRFYYYLSVGLQASLIGYMVSSFFGSVAYQWYIYYLVGYAVCFRRIYQVCVKKTAEQKKAMTDEETEAAHSTATEWGTATT